MRSIPSGTDGLVLDKLQLLEEPLPALDEMDYLDGHPFGSTEQVKVPAMAFYEFRLIGKTNLLIHGVRARIAQDLGSGRKPR